MKGRATLTEKNREKLQQQLDVENRVNPFTYDAKFGLWDLILTILGIVIVPVKFIIVFFLMCIAWVFSKLSTIGYYDDTKPLSCWRRFILSFASPVNRLILLILGVYYIDIEGKRAKFTEAPIIAVAPHSTAIDTLVVRSAIGRYSGIGKSSVKKIPLMASFVKASQGIMVDRESKEGKKQALNELVRRAESGDNRWNPLVVFPEGTCTNRKSLIQFKRGAFSSGKPIQLVTLEWPSRWFDPTWTSSSNRKLLVLKLLSQLYIPVKVKISEVIIPTEEEIEDPQLFANNVRKKAAEILDVPCTAHSYEDTFLSSAAKKSKFNPGKVVNFEFETIKDLFEIDLGEAKRLLKRFGADKKVKKTGQMDVAQFAKALKTPLSDPVIDMFDLLDTDGDGLIGFKQFLIGLTFISNNASPEDGVEILYEAFDPEGNGRIEIEQLKSVMKQVFRKVNKRTAASIMKALDPENQGYVEKETFKKYIEKNPEFLIIGINVQDAYKEKGEKIEVYKNAKTVKKRKTEIANAGQIEISVQE